MIQEIADALVQSWQLRHRVRAVRAATRRRDHHLRRGCVWRSSSAALSTALLGWASIACRCARRERDAAQADMPTAEALIAKIVFWIVWIGFIVSAVDTLQFEPFQGLVEEFFRFVPRFLVALLVLAIGFLVGNFLWRATLLASVNAGARRAPAERHAARPRDRHRRRDGARAAGTGHAVVLTAFAITFGALMLGWRSRSGWAAATPRSSCSSSSQAKKRRGRRASLVAGRMMTFPRSSGVLLHPTSLPGGFGIGDLGPSAFEFIDLLASAGQRLWQVLPSDRLAMVTRRISAFPRSPAIRCSSASND